MQTSYGCCGCGISGNGRTVPAPSHRHGQCAILTSLATHGQSPHDVRPVPPSVLTRLRKACLALPEAHEVEAWGSPTFRVKNKLFAMFASRSDHHGAGRDGAWIKCTPTNQHLLISTWPARYFKPPYVGPSGWIGVYLDASTDWEGLRELLRDGYVAVAPAKLRKALQEPDVAARVARKRRAAD